MKRSKIRYNKRIFDQIYASAILGVGDKGRYDYASASIASPDDHDYCHVYIYVGEKGKGLIGIQFDHSSDRSWYESDNILYDISKCKDLKEVKDFIIEKCDSYIKFMESIIDKSMDAWSKQNQGKVG